MGRPENDYWNGLFLSNKSRPETNEAAGRIFCVSIVFCERGPAVKPQAKYSMSKVSPQSIPLLDFCAFGGTGGLETGKWEFFLKNACKIVQFRGSIW